MGNILRILVSGALIIAVITCSPTAQASPPANDWPPIEMPIMLKYVPSESYYIGAEVLEYSAPANTPNYKYQVRSLSNYWPGHMRIV